MSITNYRSKRFATKLQDSKGFGDALVEKNKPSWAPTSKEASDPDVVKFINSFKPIDDHNYQGT